MQIVRNLPHENYLKIEALSSSAIKTISDGAPADLLLEKTETRAMMIGTAVHLRMSDPGEFFSRYASLHKLESRKKAAVEARKALLADYEERGVITLSEDEYAAVLEIGNKLESNELFKLISKDSEHEVTMLWDEPAPGGKVRCKARPDILSKIDGATYLVDIKKVADITDRGLRRAVYSFGHAIQDAWYIRGANACGIDAKAFVFIFVQESYPHHVRYVTLTGKILDDAQLKIQRAIQVYGDCLITGEFPGYPDENQVSVLDL